MPLTIAHPVAIMPLRRWGLPLSALVAGSISPDLEYLFYLFPSGTLSHSISGLFVFCLPAGLLALFIYQRLWKPAALAVLAGDSPPAPGKPFSFWPVGRLGLVCAGVLIGASSHLLWDSFTHDYGWMVRQLPVLSTTIYQGSGMTLPLFKLLQHGSTLFGMVVLAVLAWPHRRRLESFSPRAWRIIILVSCTSAAGGGAYGWIRTSRPVDLFSLKVFIGYSVITAFMLAISGTTLLSLGWHVRNRPAGP